MNQAWVQFSQRHPEHELENDQRPTISQATEATQEDDDDEEAEPLAEAPQLKKVSSVLPLSTCTVKTKPLGLGKVAAIRLAQLSTTVCKCIGILLPSSGG